MPRWKTHIEIAKRCNDFLKYNDNDYMLFIFGNILPDINNGYIISNIDKIVDRNITHFKISNSHKIHNNFLNTYKDKINNPLVFGYYTHLFTDYYFNNYTYTKLSNSFKNKEKDELRKIKQNEFKIYDNNFNDNNIFISDINLLLNELNLINEISISKNDINKIITFLNKKESNTNLNHFTTKELDNILNNVINEIKNFYLNK